MNRLPDKTIIFTPAMQEFWNDLRSCLSIDFSQNIDLEIWSKLTFITSCNGLYLITNRNLTRIHSDPALMVVLRQAFIEGLSIADLEITIDPDKELTVLLSWVDKLADISYSNLEFNLIAHEPAEIAYLSNSLLKVAKSHGVLLPVHDFISKTLTCDNMKTYSPNTIVKQQAHPASR